MKSPFNEARYRELLEGLEIVEISLSEVLTASDGGRIDPEYFSKIARKALAAITGSTTLGDLVKTGYRVVYENTKAVSREEGIERGLPFFLQSSDIVTPFIHPETMICVEESEWIRYPKGRIQPGEVLIEVKGKAEKVAIVPVSIPHRTLVTGTCYKLTTQDPLDKYLLVSFLTGKYGQALKDRLKTNLLVSYVAKDDLYSIPYPEFGKQLKQAVADCFISAEQANESSISFYKEAENLLLDALYLTDWQPPTPLTYEQPANAAFAAGRLDAEHYQPQYTALLAHLKQYAPRTRKVRDFAVKNERGTQPIYTENGPLAVINSKHILETSLDYDNFERTDVDMLNARVEPHDILMYTTGANIGRTAAYLDAAPAIASNHVNVLRLREENPVYVAVVLNSCIGRMQTRQNCAGSAQVEIYPSDIANFTVPFVADSIQRDIAQNVEAAHTARRQARQLLEAAKRAVEIAIEEGEAAGLNYLSTITNA